MLSDQTRQPGDDLRSFLPDRILIETDPGQYSLGILSPSQLMYTWHPVDLTSMLLTDAEHAWLDARKESLPT